MNDINQALADEAFRDRQVAFLAEQMAKINRYGWVITAVNTDPMFAYTTGLAAKGAPELLVAGALGLDTTYDILEELASRVHLGKRYTNGTTIDDVIGGGLSVMIIDGFYTDQLYPGISVALYGDGVRVQQVVWPDTEGRWPWDDSFGFPGAQPMLSDTTLPA